MAKLKIVFAGTPQIAADMLQALLDNNCEIIAAYTQPDRPAGRGKKITKSAVKQLAEQHNIPIYQPVNFKDPIDQQQLANLDADLMIVVAYGLLLSETVLNIPKLGCWNAHVSLLPRWRGAAPVIRAIEAGDMQTGVTIIQMDKGLDTGDILLSKTCDVSESDTSTSLYEKLGTLGGGALVECLQLQAANSLKPQKQTDIGMVYAKKLSKAEAAIVWDMPANLIVRKINAFNPWPGTTAVLNNQTIKIWRAQVLSKNVTNLKPGTIANLDNKYIDIAAKDDLVRLLEIQLPGGKVLSTAAVLASKRALFES